MNYLGHIYFSFDDLDMMYANLHGEFIKGNSYTTQPKAIQDGVKLHRFIDHTIDTHPAVRELLHELYPTLPKVSSVAVDLYFDHLLAKYWNRFHSSNLEHYLETFYAFESDLTPHFHINFIEQIKRMRQIKWLSHYKKHEGLIKMCAGVGSRFSFPHSLNDAPTVFLEKEEYIYSIFESFMHDAEQTIHEFYLNLTK